MNNKKKKKGLKILSFTLLTLIILITITLAATTIIDRISLKKEEKEIVHYGEKIDVFDGKINVVIEGKGEETIILLPGQGTASPYLDFKPLIKNLAKDYRVITIEPFGYGLSTQTKRERTVSNIVEEIHAVVEQLNIKKYTVMGHSITGLYGVNYAQKYADEMTGFIGIDSSTPEQPWPGVDLRFLDFLKQAGVFRTIINLNPIKSLGTSKENPDFQQLKLLTMKNINSQNMKEELKELDHSFPDSKGLKYPVNMPVLLFVAHNDNTMKNWLELHQDQIKSLKYGEVIELEGSHYLHHKQTKKISKKTKQFMTENIK
ncbi:alpha/beta fold hydrolase [Vagococcus sp.]|uniref:alpha/beta fold hydrolase n=1 Tax=Vagococcus sp. TaxID=1933889 RepID=UPI003F954AEA